MKRRIFKYLIIAASAALLASCLPDYEYLFTDTGMYTFAGPNRLQADSGDIYIITENKTGSEIPDTVKRVMAVCDVLSQVEGKEHEFRVRLNDYSIALCKPAVDKEGMDEEAIGNDGVNINQAWATGGYLNAYISYAVLPSSKKAHTVNLVYDSARSHSDTLFFELRHNAFGESPENTEHPLNSFVFAGAYTSFPIKDLVGNGKPILHIDWDWYDGDEYSFRREKIRRHGDIPLR